jgi:hypothetical protein
MMTYAKWWSRGPAVCDTECAEAMGWRKDGTWWRDQGGDITECAEEIPYEMERWSPTTDRNATARMVEKVAWHGSGAVERFAVTLTEEMEANHKTLTTWPEIETLLVAPSLLAYCCWRALREEA